MTGASTSTSTFDEVLHWIAIFLQFSTLIFILANCCRFKSNKNMRKPMIILFYVFAFCNTAIFVTSNLMI